MHGLKNVMRWVLQYTRGLFASKRAPVDRSYLMCLYLTENNRGGQPSQGKPHTTRK